VGLTPLTFSTGPSAADCSVVKLCAIYNSNNFQPYVPLLYANPKLL
jgi:hypothetical protein